MSSELKQSNQRLLLHYIDCKVNNKEKSVFSLSVVYKIVQQGLKNS